MSTKQILETVFNDVRLVTFVYGGKEVWFATQIAEVLGYSRTDMLSDLIHRKWSSDFIEAEDFYRVQLKDIRHIAFENVQQTFSKARQFLILTEPGINNVLSHTRKPIGRQLRRHLDTVVLPQFRRGMIVERPIEELEAEWDKERTRLLEKTLSATERAEKYAAKLIERDEEAMQLHREKAEMLGAKPYVSKMATNAGRSLQACKGARKLLN